MPSDSLLLLSPSGAAVVSVDCQEKQPPSCALATDTVQLPVYAPRQSAATPSDGWSPKHPRSPAGPLPYLASTQRLLGGVSADVSPPLSCLTAARVGAPLLHPLDTMAGQVLSSPFFPPEDQQQQDTADQELLLAARAAASGWDLPGTFQSSGVLRQRLSTQRGAVGGPTGSFTSAPSSRAPPRCAVSRRPMLLPQAAPRGEGEQTPRH